MHVQKVTRTFRPREIDYEKTRITTYNPMSTERGIDTHQRFVLIAAWTKGVTAELCDEKMNCATENNIQNNASIAAASMVCSSSPPEGNIKWPKRVEAGQSRNNREHPVVSDQKWVKMGVGQSVMANITLCRLCIQAQYTRFWPEQHRELPFLAIALSKTNMFWGSFDENKIF